MEDPNVELSPVIYHIDVAAMYPNIILTNRLQPVAIVNDRICSNCIFNDPKNNCKRVMEWQWKGDYFPLTRGEYEKRVKLQFETFSGKENVAEFHMPELKKIVKQYCQKHYKQQHIAKTILKENTVCMRENPFYVNTVRDFRDRRYIYKGKCKMWTNKMLECSKIDDGDGEKKANSLMTLYDSLQLAHKVILNSFYGYVMRRGARWYSMEMAAMVTHTGSEIIQDARKLLVKIGKPLELDTDGVWTL